MAGRTNFSNQKQQGKNKTPIKWYEIRKDNGVLEELIIPLLPQNLLETINIKHSVFFDASFIETFEHLLIM